MALVSLGILKGTRTLTDVYANMTPAQAALIYVCWKNTKRMAEALAWRIGKDNPFCKILTTLILNIGAKIWVDALKRYFVHVNPENERAIEKAERYTHIKTMGTDFRRFREQYKAMLHA
jgi:hypothetical protein